MRLYENVVVVDCFNKLNDIEFFKDNNISLNPILFDTYYDEGIMNA
jgi:hypothetical protein